MEKTIYGCSVDKNLLTGAKAYGNLGNLIGVVDFGDKNIAIIKNQQNQYVYRDIVIDVSASMTKNGPEVREQIFMGKTEKQLDNRIETLLVDVLSKTGNLSCFGYGEVNIDLGLQQFENSVFIAEDDFLDYLKTCKDKYPELPLIHAIEIIPYENESTKTMI